MADDATSVPGSLFGNLPIQSNDRSNQVVNENDDAQSYVDFYARLGGSNRNRSNQDHSAVSSRLTDSDDLEASLLGGGSDAATTAPRLDLRSPSSTWFAKNSKHVNALVIVSGVVLIIVMLWWVTGGGREIEPTVWQPPSSYQVSFVISLSSGSEEPGIAMVDQNIKAMRLSYYSGMTTFIINSTGSSYSIVPRMDTLTCFEQSEGVPLQSVFPDTKLFKYSRQASLTLKPRGAKVNVQTDSPTNSKKKKISTTMCEEWVHQTSPADDKYRGIYTLWTTSGENGVPVRFSFVGHNVLLGADHYDNFTIDYYNFRDLTIESGIDPFWFKPPRGMSCSHVPGKVEDSPSSHIHSLKMLFPEEEEHRNNEYMRFHSQHSTKEKSESRKAIFHETLRMIDMHNRDATKSYKLGVNFMADWNMEERRAFSRKGMKEELGKSLPPSNCEVEPLTNLLEEAVSANIPRSIDHQVKGLLLPPEDQSICGSWAAAAIGTIEAQIAKKSGKPIVPLSKQNILDCSWINPESVRACHGGLDYTAFSWVIENNDGQVATEDSYPFLGQDGFCHYDVKRKLISEGAHAQIDAPKVTKCLHVGETFQKGEHDFQPEDLVKALNLRLYTQGPLAVSMFADDNTFYMYKSGVFELDGCKSDYPSLDHTVLAVGYNLSDSQPYTKIRNNWSQQWGEKGFARIAQKNNQCGLATSPIYVLVEGESEHPTPMPTSPPTTMPPTTLSPSTSSPATAPPTTMSPITNNPTPSPSRETHQPTLNTNAPSQHPTGLPTTRAPSPPPTVSTAAPSPNPTRPQDTQAPSPPPTLQPTVPPSTISPTQSPTRQPTPSPPTGAPTATSSAPTTVTSSPTTTSSPTIATSSPTLATTGQPTAVTSQPTVATIQPTLPTTPPTITTIQPTVATIQPTVATIQPTIQTSQPTIATSQPTVATSQPTVTTSQPTLATSQPTVATSQPTVATTQPTVATSQPTTPTNAPTSTTSAPTDPPTLAPTPAVS